MNFETVSHDLCIRKQRYQHLKADVCVTEISVFRDPELADVKLAQAKHLLARLTRFRTQVSDTFECNPPVMVAGDFNSTPGDKVRAVLSLLIELILVVFGLLFVASPRFDSFDLK